MDDSEARLLAYCQYLGYKSRGKTAPADGNGFFHAVSDQLDKLGLEPQSHADIRANTIEYMRNQIFTQGEQQFRESFITAEHFPPIEHYLKAKAKDKSWADPVLVEATAKYLNRPIWIIKSSPECCITIKDSVIEKINPEAQHEEDNCILLGHFHETLYQSLEVTKASNELDQKLFECSKRKLLSENCLELRFVLNENLPANRNTFDSAILDQLNLLLERGKLHLSQNKKEKLQSQINKYSKFFGSIDGTSGHKFLLDEGSELEREIWIIDAKNREGIFIEILSQSDVDDKKLLQPLIIGRCHENHYESLIETTGLHDDHYDDDPEDEMSQRAVGQLITLKKNDSSKSKEDNLPAGYQKRFSQRLHLHRNAFKVKKECTDEKRKLSVIAMIGKFRTGKSSCLNLWNDLENDGFPFTNSAKGCTKGICMYHKEIGDRDVISLDCQGFYDVEGENFEDKMILLLALLSSSVLVLNVKTNIGREHLNTLHAICETVSTYQRYLFDGIPPKFPKLVVLIRDDDLEGEDFETRLENMEDISKRDKIKECFPSRETVKFDRPAQKIKNIQTWSFTNPEIDDDFKEAARLLWKNLIEEEYATEHFVDQENVMKEWYRHISKTVEKLNKVASMLHDLEQPMEVSLRLANEEKFYFWCNEVKRKFYKVSLIPSISELMTQQEGGNENTSAWKEMKNELEKTTKETCQAAAKYLSQDVCDVLKTHGMNSIRRVSKVHIYLKFVLSILFGARTTGNFRHTIARSKLNLNMVDIDKLLKQLNDFFGGYKVYKETSKTPVQSDEENIKNGGVGSADVEKQSDQIDSLIWRIKTEDQDSVKAQAKNQDSLEAQAQDQQSMKAQAQDQHSVKAQAKDRDSVEVRAKCQDSVKAQTEDQDSVKAQTEDQDSVKAQTEDQDSVKAQTEDQSNKANEFVVKHPIMYGNEFIDFMKGRCGVELKKIIQNSINVGGNQKTKSKCEMFLGKDNDDVNDVLIGATETFFYSQELRGFKHWLCKVPMTEKEKHPCFEKCQHSSVSGNRCNHPCKTKCNHPWTEHWMTELFYHNLSEVVQSGVNYYQRAAMLSLQKIISQKLQLEKQNTLPDTKQASTGSQESLNENESKSKKKKVPTATLR